MGNYCCSSCPYEILQEEFNYFIKENCYSSDSSYCNYWELGTVFSIFLQTHKSSNYFLLFDWLKKYRNKNPSSQDWDCLAYQFINYLCEKSLLKRYGSPTEFPLIIGIKVDKLKTQQQYI